MCPNGRQRMAVFVHEFKPLLNRDLGWQMLRISGIVARFPAAASADRAGESNRSLDTSSLGEVAEWSKAAVLKTVEPRGSQGSNPCLSAIIKKSPFYRGFFNNYE